MNSNDILVTAYPKSGITYLGFLLTAARLHHNHIRMRPTMYNIDYLLVDEHKMHSHEIVNIWKDGIGSFIKTHSYWRHAPNVIYLLRDPVAALKSYRHFKKQLGDEDPLNAFLSKEIPAWEFHVRSWLIDNGMASQSIFVTQYEDLTSQPFQECAQILRLGLGLLVTSDSIDQGVLYSNLSHMRESESDFVKRNPVNAKFDLNFVRKGDSREVDEFTPDVCDMIRERTQKTYDKARELLK